MDLAVNIGTTFYKKAFLLKLLNSVVVAHISETSISKPGQIRPELSAWLDPTRGK